MTVPKEDQHLSKSVPTNYKVFLASITMLTMVHPMTTGYDSMMVGGILNLESYLTYFSLTPVTIGLNSAATWMGSILAAITIVQWASDKFGRKKSIVLGISILVVGVVLQSAAQDIAMFIVGRILIGYGSNVTSISAICLVAELCPTNLRGFLMGLAFSSFLIGALLSSGITYAFRNAPGDWNWRIPSIIQMAPNVIAAANLVFLPESPKFLISKGYFTKAYDTILIVCRQDAEKATEVLEEYKIEVEMEKLQSKTPWAQFFKSRINVHKGFINMTHGLLTEMAGSSVGSHYLSILLTQAGIASSTERLQVNVVMSAWQLICAVSGCLSFDRIGRKLQAMVSLSGMVICFYILGGLIKTYGDGHNESGSWGTIAVMFMFSGFYSFTYTPLTSLYPSELYPYKMRSAGTTLFSFFNSGFGLVSSFVLPIAMSNIGWRYYIVNASYDLLFLPVIFYFWVETKGEDIELIDQKFWAHPINRGREPVGVIEGETDSDVVERESVEVGNKV